jgi:hypothetical protein
VGEEEDAGGLLQGQVTTEDSALALVTLLLIVERLLL